MAMATFPSFHALSPLSPSAPPSSLLHDLTISLLGTKFDSDGPPFRLTFKSLCLPIWQFFSCPTEQSRRVIFVMAVMIGGCLGPSAGPTGVRCFRSSSISLCSHTAHLSHLQMFGSSVFHLVPAVAGLCMCMCLATSIFLSWFHRLWSFFVFFKHICKIRARFSYKLSHNTPFLAPPLAPQGCIHFSPLRPVASSFTSVILCLFIVLLYLSLDGVISEAFIYVYPIYNVTCASIRICNPPLGDWERSGTWNQTRSS
jgi:hypothetical protein